MAYELHRIFRDAAAGKEIPYAAVDRIAADFAAYQKNWSVELVEQIRYLNRERADYRLKFFRIYKSWSWLMVKPALADRKNTEEVLNTLASDPCLRPPSRPVQALCNASVTTLASIPAAMRE